MAKVRILSSPDRLIDPSEPLTIAGTRDQQRWLAHELFFGPVPAGDYRRQLLDLDSPKPMVSHPPMDPAGLGKVNSTQIASRRPKVASNLGHPRNTGAPLVRDMTTGIKVNSSPEPFAHSTFWDIFIPMLIVAVPSGAFKLLGLVTVGLNQPGAIAPIPVIVAMVVLQSVGIVAMAYVILIRFEGAFRQLSFLTNEQPRIWRRLVLFLSMACLLLSDVLTNVSAAFAGAGLLLVVAVPAFIAYIVCKHVAFAWLPAGTGQ